MTRFLERALFVVTWILVAGTPIALGVIGNLWLIRNI